MNNFIVEIIRALPRPAIAIMFGAAIVDSVVCGRPLPTWFLSIAIPVIAWYFGERAWTHKKERDNVL